MLTRLKSLFLLSSFGLCLLAGNGVALAQNVNVQWVKGATAESLVVGNPEKDKPLNVCRAKLTDGNMHVGVAWNGTCYVGFGGKSVNSPVEETLVMKTSSWVPAAATKGPPPNAVISADGGAPIHVCRAADPTKNLRPGKAWKGNCYIAYGKDEHKIATFDYLIGPK